MKFGHTLEFLLSYRLTHLSRQMSLLCSGHQRGFFRRFFPIFSIRVTLFQTTEWQYDQMTYLVNA